MFSRKRLGELIGEVFLGGDLCDLELVLFDVTLDCVIFDIHGLGLSRGRGATRYYGDDSFVVALDLEWIREWKSKLLKNLTDLERLVSSMEEGDVFHLKDGFGDDLLAFAGPGDTRTSIHEAIARGGLNCFNFGCPVGVRIGVKFLTLFQVLVA